MNNPGKRSDDYDDDFTTVRLSRQQGWRSRTSVKLICLLSALLAIRAFCWSGLKNFVISHADAFPEQLTDPIFDWDSITPSVDIEWKPCFTDFQCARLILPLDYLSPSGVGPNVTIALQMLPAADKGNAKGTIFINPGGPGGSGTGFVLAAGKNMSQVVGRSFNILGFDPRGTGASTPSAQCFVSDSQYKAWKLQAGDRVLNLTDGSVGLALARERAVGAMCKTILAGNGKEDPDGTVDEWGAGRFMNTESVATDMLRITEKLGEDRLKYWGFSYGSVLGQYFAAMYPDKVGRLIIDGVYDGYNYRNTSWNSNLADADAVWESFFTFCNRAGPEKCSLYMPSVAEVKDRVLAIMDHVGEEPFPVPFAGSGPLIVTRKALHNFAFQALYRPIRQFSSFADALLAVERSNQTILAELSKELGGGYECNCERELPWLVKTEATSAIMCGDGEPITHSPKEFQEWFSGLSASSQFASPIWGLQYLRCAGWQIRPKWRYTGPLAAENTSHPILVVSPMYDPVCPLSDARAVRARYGGAGLLIQNSFGHCSRSAPSLCTAKYVREYFVNGTLPEEETVCEVDELPFVGPAAEGWEKLSRYSDEDRSLMEALRGLAVSVPISGFI
ncbi:uncharacterized protein FIBRA_00563 [Fibroporia radiculosa]|uniref:AB hydrolase-1 domain-containing protein n=1 Tax=Fibroporia radiculosa TaxID=599839 RepID=J4G0F0_9APHY|nr:uncharacterized protein FIBRA_00563 [Fibroporia radiculosa]CCL98563.1 predicted protein [Fibroporia radiculosa]